MKLKIVIENFINNIKQIKRDIDNRKNFEFDIKREITNPNSGFNILGLSIDEKYNHISSIIKMPAEIQIKSNDAQKYNYLKDESKAVTMYIGTALNWGEYFLAPTFYYIEDEEDVDNISCTYLAVWEYKPVILKNTKFWLLLSSIVTSIIAIIVTSIILLV